MELLENERQMGTCASLIATNYRLVQEEKSLGRKVLKEIPLEKLDSIAYDYARSPAAILIGIFLSLSGYYLTLAEEVFLPILAIGLLVLIIGLFWKREFTEFRSASMVIREEREGMEEFTNIVRKQLYGIRPFSGPSQNYRTSLSQEDDLSTPRIVSIDR